MKSLAIILSALFSVPAFAAQPDLKLCRGSFMISSALSTQATTEGFLAGSVRANILAVKVNGSGANKIYQVRANNGAVDSATAVMEVLARLDGVIVECDSELGQ